MACKGLPVNMHECGGGGDSQKVGLDCAGEEGGDMHAQEENLRICY